MEIKYITKTNNFYEYYNDLLNFYSSYKKILEKNKKIIYYKDYKKNNVKNIINYTLLNIILILSIIIVNIPIYRIICLLLLILYLLATISIVIFLKKDKANYIIVKKNLNESKGTIIINKKGIQDTSDDNDLFYDWNNLKCCIISKQTIFIIYKTNAPVLIFPQNIENKLTEAIKKYNKDFEIIYIEDYIKKEK